MDAYALVTLLVLLIVGGSIYAYVKLKSGGAPLRDDLDATPDHDDRHRRWISSVHPPEKRHAREAELGRYFGSPRWGRSS